MPIYTTAITGSNGTGIVQLSGSIKTAGFLSALGVGNASVINHPTTIPEDYNSLLYGPITVKHTGSLTISSGAVIKIEDIEEASDSSDSSSGASGDVAGPGSSTDNAIARFDGTGGKTLQNSGCTIDDSNNLTIAGDLTISGADSGSIAGPGSYLGVTSTGQVVLTSSAGGGGDPGGSDTQIQYNNGGAFGGVASLTFNDSDGHLTIIDDKKLQFGSNADASIEYDENGTDKLIISGAAGGFDIDLPDNVASALEISEEANPYMTFITTNSSEGIKFSQDIVLVDDKKIWFGSDEDASIEYDEDGDNYLIISGSVTGLALSGGLISLESDTLIKDDKKFYFGSDENAYIEYNEDGDDNLIISGSATGLVLSGAMLTFDPTTVDSGSIAGAGSYLGVTSTGQVVLTSSAGAVSAVANGSNNRVATFSSSDALNGEANLTFDGTDATVGSAGKIQFRDTGIYVNSDEDGHLQVVSDGHMTLKGYPSFEYGIGTSATSIPSVFSEEGDGFGDVMKLLNTTIVKGDIYYLSSSSPAWVKAQANDTNDGGTGELLGVAMGTNSNTHGLLLRGLVRIDTGSYNGTAVIGDAGYLSDDTAGQLDFTAPADSGEVVRVLGNCVQSGSDGNIVFYFNPSGDYVEIA